MNDIIKGLEIKNTEISCLQQELKDKDKTINKLEKMLVVKEQYIKHNEEVYTEYQEDEHLFVVLRNIFPELEVNERTNNTTFLKILERSVKNTQCERSKDSKHIEYLLEQSRNKDTIIQAINNQFKQLHSELLSQKELMNKLSIFESQVNKNDKEIKQLQE